MLVGDLGAARESPPQSTPYAADVLLGERAVVGVGEQPVEQLAQVRVDGVPVEPDRVVERRVVGKHAPRVPPSPLSAHCGARYVRRGRSPPSPLVGSLRRTVRAPRPFASGSPVSSPRSASSVRIRGWSHPRRDRDLCGAAAACGGGGTDRLSASDYRSKASTHCEQLKDASDELAKAQDPSATGATVTRFLRGAADGLRELVDGLDGLEPPASLEPHADELVGLLGDYADGLDELAESVQRWRHPPGDVRPQHGARAATQRRGGSGDVTRHSARALGLHPVLRCVPPGRSSRPWP